MTLLTRLGLALVLGSLTAVVSAQTPATSAAPAYDARMAARLGADQHGMRHYVLVLLRTGPRPVPEGPAREAMFKGHMANIQRLANEGKLVLAGPLDGKDALRGLFVFAVSDIDAAKQLVATDPVIARGEMVAEYHAFYSSAALMLVNEAHPKLAREAF